MHMTKGIKNDVLIKVIMFNDVTLPFYTRPVTKPFIFLIHNLT